MSEPGREPPRDDPAPPTASQGALPATAARPQAGNRDHDPPPIPRLPRGKGVAISGLAVTRILMVAGLLVAVLVLRKPCSEGVAGFISRFEPDAAPAAQQPQTPPGALITGDMSDEERERLIEQEMGRTRSPDGDRTGTSTDRAGTGTGTDHGGAGPRDAGPR